MPMLAIIDIMTKIAIIEDDFTISQMYRMKFQSDNFKVGMAGDGESGINLVKSFDPDIILLDIQMPDTDGIEVLKYLATKPKLRDIPVVVLTNLGKEEAPDELKKFKVHSYILKADLTPKQVVDHVKKALKTATT